MTISYLRIIHNFFLFTIFRQTGDDQLAVSVDAGWQKRGSGKAYDSLSGMNLYRKIKKD